VSPPCKNVLGEIRARVEKSNPSDELVSPPTSDENRIMLFAGMPTSDGLRS
jgi:hypothetical protein